MAFLPLMPHAANRRNRLQAMYKTLESEIESLNKQVADQAGNRPGAQRLVTHPGVGPVMALATDVFLGDPHRFADGKALASYVGIIPREYLQRRAAAARRSAPTGRSARMHPTAEGRRYCFVLYRMGAGSSTILKSAGTVNKDEFGSARTMFVRRNVCSPMRGSLRLL